MTQGARQSSEAANDASFFSALMEEIIAGVMIPKVQIERVIGPLLGYFLPGVLTEMLGKNVVLLCPEFPIRKMSGPNANNRSNQSTNIDWLMLIPELNELIFVELKTTDTTFNDDQAAIYGALQNLIKKDSAKFLVEDLMEIGAASQEPGKYLNAFEQIEKRWGGSTSQARNCYAAKVLYIGPKGCRPADWPPKGVNEWDWRTFNCLPSTISHPHHKLWPILHQHLKSLDLSSHQVRNSKAKQKIRDALFVFRNSQSEVNP